MSTGATCTGASKDTLEDIDDVIEGAVSNRCGTCSSAKRLSKKYLIPLQSLARNASKFFKGGHSEGTELELKADPEPTALYTYICGDVHAT